MFSLKKITTRLAVLAGLTIPITFQGCINIFDPLDSPTGDAQLLAAARACFDEGDLSCAREYYGKLAGNEDAIAELAFVRLDEQGADISALVKALTFTTGESVGSILNELTESVARKGLTPGTAKRDEFIASFNAIYSITNAELRGFVRFLVGMTLAAEILAEDTGALDGTLSKSDIATGGAACTAAGCAADADCNTPAAGVIAAGAGVACTTFFPAAGTATMAGAVDWDMFSCAVSQANTGLTEMNVSSGNSLTLITTVLAAASTSNRCMRAALVDGIGAGR